MESPAQRRRRKHGAHHDLAFDADIPKVDSEREQQSAGAKGQKYPGVDDMGKLAPGPQGAIEDVIVGRQGRGLGQQENNRSENKYDDQCKDKISQESK